MTGRRAREVPGAVGVWRETCEISPAGSVYVDVPTTGLAAARPVAGRLDRAATRLAG